MPSTYQIEQFETLTLIYQHLNRIDVQAKQRLKDRCKRYLKFRKHVDDFLSRHFSRICTKQCYENRLSACCSREGIITFFADMLINVLFSENCRIEYLMAVLNGDGDSEKCIYLGEGGCLWHIKPVNCEMFLCNRAKATVFNPSPEIGQQWKDLEQDRKAFTWPDKPVIFDEFEKIFMDAGFSSPLMYFHNSPGLLRVKQLAGKSNAAY